MTGDAPRDVLRLAILISIAVPIHTAYWFIRGQYRGAFTAGNAAVVPHAVLGVSAGAWFWYRSRRRNG